MVGVLMDITDHHEAVLALKRAAEIDELTGLLSRTGFAAPLEDAVRRQQTGNAPLFLLMFDLYGVKDTNDIYGHLIGDVALRESLHAYARWCRRNIRSRADQIERNYQPANIWRLMQASDRFRRWAVA